MGYRGKVEERERARALRAAGATMPEIAASLGVSRSSVSLWTRDVPVGPRARRRPADRRPSRLAVEKQAEIDRLRAEGVQRIGSLSERDLLIAGAALYAGEGAKTDGVVKFANSDPAMVQFFCGWLRRFFDIDESRLRCQVYLHQGLDLDAAEQYWADLTDIPRAQFRKAYRPGAGERRGTVKHVRGCAYVIYPSASIHREVMGVVRGLLSSQALNPG